MSSIRGTKWTDGKVLHSLMAASRVAIDVLRCYIEETERNSMMATSIYDSGVDLHWLDTAQEPPRDVPTVDISSGDSFPLVPRATTVASSARKRSAKRWLQREVPAKLDGNVLLCPCPDCGAPMTIRIWLSTADCWRCATSIALSLEQVREIERALQREKDTTAAAAPTTPLGAT